MDSISVFEALVSPDRSNIERALTALRFRPLSNFKKEIFQIICKHANVSQILGPDRAAIYTKVFNTSQKVILKQIAGQWKPGKKIKNIDLFLETLKNPTEENLVKSFQLAQSSYIIAGLFVIALSENLIKLDISPESEMEILNYIRDYGDNPLGSVFGAGVSTKRFITWTLCKSINFKSDSISKIFNECLGNPWQLMGKIDSGYSDLSSQQLCWLIDEKSVEDLRHLKNWVLKNPEESKWILERRDVYDHLNNILIISDVMDS